MLNPFEKRLCYFILFNFFAYSFLNYKQETLIEVLKIMRYNIEKATE
jgi:hypothetical protein